MAEEKPVLKLLDYPIRFIDHLTNCSIYQPMTFDAIKDILSLIIASDGNDNHDRFLLYHSIYFDNLDSITEFQFKLKKLGFYQIVLSGRCYYLAEAILPNLAKYSPIIISPLNTELICLLRDDQIEPLLNLFDSLD